MAVRPAQRRPTRQDYFTEDPESTASSFIASPGWAKPGFRTLRKPQGFVRGLLFALGLLILAGIAGHAADFVLASADGIWTSADTSVTGLGSGSILWGRSTGSGRSGFEFSGALNESFSVGETFLIGTFTHRNKPVSGTTPTRLELRITLDFDTPAVSPNPVFTYVLDFDETPNSCYNQENPLNCCPSWQESGTPCDDRILFPAGSLSDTFWVGETRYALEILGFTSSPSGGTGVSQFVTEEGMDNVAYVVGRLTVVCSLPSITAQPLSQSVYETSSVVLAVNAIGDGLSYQWHKDGSVISGATGSTLALSNLAASDAGDYTVDVSNACGSVTSEIAVLTVLEPDCANYDIEFLSSSFDGANTTFRYRVTSYALPEVSHWILGVGDCITASDIVSASPGSVAFGHDPTTGVYGVKFDSSVPMGSPMIFSVTFVGYRPEATTSAESSIKAAIKAGEKVCVNSTTGPSCTVADLELTKTVDEPAPQIGESATYTVTLINKGPASATNVKVQDNLPSGVDYVSHLVSQGSYSEITGAWQVGTLSVGAVETLSVTGTVLESGDTVNTAEVSQCSVPDPDSTPNNGASSEDDQDNATITPTASPALTVEKTGTASVEFGGTVEYTITVTNTGNIALHNVTVTDAKLGLYESIPSLAVDASETMTVTYGPVDASDLPEIVNTVVVAATETGPATDTHTTNINISPGIAVSKTSSHADGQVGETVTYAYAVWNTGNAPLSSIVLSDDIVGPVSGPVSGDGNSNGQLDPSETWTFEAAYAIDWADRNGFSGGSHTLTNVVTAAGTAPDSTTVSSTADATLRICTVDLSLTKSAPGEAVAGGQIVYTIVVTNHGPVDTATHVVVSDPLSNGLSSATYEIVSGGFGSGLWTGSLDLGDLAYPSSVTIEITATVDPAAPSSLVNRACVSNRVFDPNEADNCDSTTTTVLVPGVSIDKTGPASAQVGEEIVYTLVVTNTGDLTLHHVVVTDPLTGLDTDLGDLSPGTSQTLNPVYTVTEGDLPGPLVNTATARSDETAEVRDDHAVTILIETGAIGDLVWEDENANGLQDESGAGIAGVRLILRDETGAFLRDTTTNSLGNYRFEDCPRGNYTVEIDGASLALAGYTPTTATSVVATIRSDFLDADFGLVGELPPVRIDLSLRKTVSDPTPSVGDEIVFTIAVRNEDGFGSATGIRIKDTLPSGYRFVSSVASVGTYDRATEIWEIPVLNAGKTARMGITAIVNAEGNYVGPVEVIDAGEIDVDSTPGNAATTPEDDDDEAVVMVVGPYADLAILKTAGQETVGEGDEVAFTVVLSNHGPADATRIVVADLLPAGLEYLNHAGDGAYDAATGLWTIESLSAGDVAELAVRTRALLGTGGLSLTNIAEVRSTEQTDPDESNNRDDATVTVGTNGGGGGTIEACSQRVIISEIAWAGTAADPSHEWIELRNLGSEPVDLTGWILRWRRKQPLSDEDLAWKSIPLSGVLVGAEVSACDAAQYAADPAVSFERRAGDILSWWVVALPQQGNDSHLLLERITDRAVSNVQADLVWDPDGVLELDLSDDGDIVELLDANGHVVDSANAFEAEHPGWPAGEASIRATMERTDPRGPDSAENWHTNVGVLTYGIDAMKRPLVATAAASNSPSLDEMTNIVTLEPTPTRAGARIEVGLELDSDERRSRGWPWIRVTRPVDGVGGGGATAPSAYSFAGRYSRDLYWLGIETANLAPGDHMVWIVFGEGEAILVPITILP